MSDENTKVVDEKVVEDEKEKQEIILINEETIQDRIYIIRGQKVMLDFELAEIYGYSTKAFNQQVKNNEERFEEDFRFKLTRKEVENLRSKNLTSSWGGTRYLPYSFTEQEKIFHCGPSSKDGGMRIGSIVEIREREAYHTLVDELLKMPELQLA